MEQSPIVITISGGDEQLRMLIAAAIDTSLVQTCDNKIMNQIDVPHQLPEQSKLDTLFRLAYQARPQLRNVSIVIQEAKNDTDS